RGRRGPRSRSHRRRRSRAGLHARLHRCVSAHRLGVCRYSAAPCDSQEISNEFPRPGGTRYGRSACAHRRPVMTCRRVILAVLFAAGASAAFAQSPEMPQPRHITLREAVDLALARNHAVCFAHFPAEERDHAKDVAKSSYFPQVRNDTTLVRLTDTQLVEIPAGGLGIVGLNPIPPQTLIPHY